MPYIQWMDGFTVKVDVFDRDHKKLVEIFNTLYDAIQERKSRENLGKFLNELVNYTAYHFAQEEEIMVKHNYPGLAAHKRIHGVFVDQVLDFKGKYETGEVTLDLKLMDFLKGWITDHILRLDRMYSTFFNNRDVR